MADKPRALVLGHSFISRLENAFRHGLPPLRMNLAQYNVRMVGRGGASVRDILRRDVLAHNSIVRRFRPAAVILQVGGNCLCGLEAAEVRRYMIRLVEALLGFDFIHRVVVLQVFARHKPRYINVEEYEDRREELNSFLAAWVSLPSLRERTISWSHRRLEQSPMAVFHSDGVHLSRGVGIPKYWRVVRGAIIHGLAGIEQ